MAAGVIYTGARLPSTWNTSTTWSDEDAEDLALMAEAEREYEAGAWTSVEEVFTEVQRRLSSTKAPARRISKRRPI